MGKDMRTQNRSWAGEAGAIVSTPHDLALWIHALFENRVFPEKQLDEMTTLVSDRGRVQGLAARPSSRIVREPGREPAAVVIGADARGAGGRRVDM
jgi:hypothetical protein